MEMRRGARNSDPAVASYAISAADIITTTTATTALRSSTSTNDDDNDYDYDDELSTTFTGVSTSTSLECEGGPSMPLSLSMSMMSMPRVSSMMSTSTSSKKKTARWSWSPTTSSATTTSNNNRKKMTMKKKERMSSTLSPPFGSGASCGSTSSLVGGGTLGGGGDEEQDSDEFMVGIQYPRMPSTNSNESYHQVLEELSINKLNVHKLTQQQQQQGGRRRHHHLYGRQEETNKLRSLWENMWTMHIHNSNGSSNSSSNTSSRTLQQQRKNKKKTRSLNNNKTLVVVDGLSGVGKSKLITNVLKTTVQSSKYDHSFFVQGKFDLVHDHHQQQHCNYDNNSRSNSSSSGHNNRRRNSNSNVVPFDGVKMAIDDLCDQIVRGPSCSNISDDEGGGGKGKQEDDTAANVIIRRYDEIKKLLVEELHHFVHRWSHRATAHNPNALHLEMLLSAELDASRGKTSSAYAKYKSAILMAGRIGLIQDQALSNERFASYCQQQHDVEEAEYRLKCAMGLYTEWAGKLPERFQSTSSHTQLVGESYLSSPSDLVHDVSADTKLGLTSPIL